MNEPREFGGMRWSKYVLKNGRECYLTQRPDCAEPNSVNEFIAETRPIVRFQFTDDYVNFPIFNPTTHWYPWVPGDNIPLECVYAFMCLMDRYVHSSSKGSIWLHCDSSSMRAPTYFGIYVFSTNSAREAIKISKAMTVSDNSELKYATYSRIDKYVRYSLDQDRGVKEFVKAWKAEGEVGGHKLYMDTKELSRRYKR